ncbi:N-acetylglutamate synthase [Rhizodiscina lignyota]|uniref:Amino-acid acetyltransferase, mitochondrial n=1 Tax=Rhizodiscina lignyota TaxID=1504668 RepID=A0A9P4M6B6_9PEZI|nr:N-acetylglutamate synthase [Rhizodiscina lignyota]
MKPGRLKQASIGPSRAFPANVARAWYSGSQRPQDDAKDPSPDQHPAKRSRVFDKNFFLSVLSASATKRDAKGYLSRFFPPKAPKDKAHGKNQDSPSVNARPVPYARGINLGNLYSPAKAIEQSPVFTQQKNIQRSVHAPLDLHVAIVKLRDPQTLSDVTLDGVALTIAQLARLGMMSTVVVGCGGLKVSTPEDFQRWRDLITEQSHRLAVAIQRVGKTRAQLLDQILGVSDQAGAIPSNVQLRGGVQISYYQLLLSALRNGVIPIITPVAYNEHQQAERVSSNDVMLALTRQFAGLNVSTLQEKDFRGIDGSAPQVQGATGDNVTLDRVILLDPLGGIPASDRHEQSHIFINMEQEYRTIREELLRASDESEVFEQNPEPTPSKHSILGASNPFSAFAEDETVASNVLQRPKAELSKPAGALTSEVAQQHVQNLELLQKSLALLPPSSSALIIRPQDVATAALSHTSAAGVRTRQQRNPLIHNLLTDKPIISSSLPSGRLASSSTSTFSASTSSVTSAPSPHATFVKRGMPVTIIPDPRTHPWHPPGPNGTSLSLSDPRIDFPRLLHLIEDSFGRKLDVQHYLSRIQNHLAGVIIAGEYEGGAILTWESPPRSHSNPSSAAGRSSGSRPPIPYLDKFAVLKRSQGAGGVADIVFNAMVRDCLPSGVVWRSRKENPVNKWYFERADGTWKIPESGWTMFWTGEELWGAERRSGEAGGGGVVRAKEWREERWKDYVAVCRGIEASWADKKAPD